MILLSRIRLCLSFGLLFLFIGSFGQPITPKDTFQVHQFHFIQDSVQSFHHDIVDDNIVKPITASVADVELRLYIRYFMPGNMGEVWMLRYTNNQLLAERYRYCYQSSSIPYDPSYTVLGRNAYAYINRRIDTLSFASVWPTSFQTLINQSIFSVADQSDLLNSLQKQGIKVKDPCEGVLDCFSKSLIYLEAKRGEQVRNFRLLSNDYYTLNPSIAVFRQRHYIMEAFRDIFRRMVQYNDSSH